MTRPIRGRARPSDLNAGYAGNVVLSSSAASPAKRGVQTGRAPGRPGCPLWLAQQSGSVSNLSDIDQNLMTVTIRLLTAADADSYIRMWSNFAGYLRNLGDADEQGMTREKFLRDGFGADPAFTGFIAEIDG